jgi:sugar (pentulose or hexulose) kinase
MKRLTKSILAALLLNVALCSWASADTMEEEEVDALTTEEKVENAQERVEDTHDRYDHAERQYNRLKNAEDADDYLEVIERIKIFN